MLDLKPYLDAVNAARDEVQRVADDIHALFVLETDESKRKALELRPTLEAAQNREAEAFALYEAMQRANRPNDMAKNFVPVSNTPPDDAEGHQPTVIKRKEYDALSLVARAEFIRSGGRLTD